MSNTPAALQRIRLQLIAQRRPCHICGMAIDYDLPWQHHQAFTVEHILPRKTHPHLVSEPSNCVAAHASCNKAKGDKDIPPNLGSLSRNW